MTIDERLEFLIQSSESHNQQIGELTVKMGELTANVTRLVEVTNQDASAIRTLARIAEVHERRLTDLESGE
jgi:hypothetical protein